MEPIHEKIKHRREELGYSQKGVARDLGISQQAFSKKENGINAFTKKELAALPGIFKTTSEKLYGPGPASPGQAQPHARHPDLFEEYIFHFGKSIFSLFRKVEKDEETICDNQREIRQLLTVVFEQQKTINRLIKLIPRSKHKNRHSKVA